MKYRHAIVADLAWAVSSPPLLRNAGGDCNWPDDDWYRAFYRQIEPELQRLDRNPDRLAALVAAEKDQRLGRYFETLWRFAVELHPRYRVRAQNLQVHDGGTTLGEFDFLVEDGETGRLAHWELAVKFYLDCGDPGSLAGWVGPHKRDRLDRKLAHMNSKQTRLHRHPQAAAVLADHGLHIDCCSAILKGCLFSPLDSRNRVFADGINAAHVHGLWTTRHRLLEWSGPEDRFQPLLHSGWMSGIPTVGANRKLGVRELIDGVERGEYPLPLYVNAWKTASVRARLFIVDEHWAETPA